MLNKIKNAITDPKRIWQKMGMLGLLNWMPSERYIRIAYRLAFGRRLNLSNPQAYTEKLNWYKLHWYNPLAIQCVDKYDVRDYVKEKIGESYLNELYGVWKSFEDIDFDSLPQQFVLKVTNGSGDIYICHNKSDLNMKQLKKKMNRFSRNSIYYANREWPYKITNRRYIAERLIQSSDEHAIKDYKIFCFHGVPKFCFVGSDRDTHVKFDFFDTSWNYIPVRNGHDHKNPLPQRPVHWEEMLDIAKKLSADFPHVRVDLYEEEDRVFFGELTFFHFAGLERFEPDYYDFEFGKLFDLHKINPKELR